MKEIMQLFRRDAEHAPPERGDATSYTLGQKIGVLNGPRSGHSGGERSREGSALSSSQNNMENSVLYVGERKLAAEKPKAKARATEDSVYGRRW